MKALLCFLAVLSLGLRARADEPLAAPERPASKGERSAKAAPKATPKAAPAPKAKAAPKAIAKATPPAPAKGAQGGEGEEGGAEGYAFVLEDTDAVVLRDGTRITGTVVCAGQAAVTLLTKEGDKTVEKTIPREQIERVIKNADGEFPKKFATLAVDGHKFLTDAEVTEPGDPESLLEGEPGERPAARPKAPGKGPAAKGPASKAPTPPAGKLPGGLQLPPGLKLPGGMQLPKDPAQIRGMLERFKKDGTLDKLLKDPAIRQAIEKATK